MRKHTGQQARKQQARNQQARNQQARSGRLWSGADRMRLELLAENQVPVEMIARKLRRSVAAVRTEARKQRLVLAPAQNQPVAKQLAFTDKRAYGGLQIAGETTPSGSAYKPAQRKPAQRRPARRGHRPAPPQVETLF